MSNERVSLRVRCHSLIRPPAYDGLIDQSPSQRSNSATRRSSAGTRRSSSCARATSLDRSSRIPSATVWVSLASETPSTIPEACWCRSPTCLAWCRSLPCSYLRRRPTHWQWCRACCRHLPTSRPTNEIELPMPAYLVHTHMNAGCIVALNSNSILSMNATLHWRVTLLPIDRSIDRLATGSHDDALLHRCSLETLLIAG